MTRPYVSYSQTAWSAAACMNMSVKPDVYSRSFPVSCWVWISSYCLELQQMIWAQVLVACNSVLQAGIAPFMCKNVPNHYAFARDLAALRVVMVARAVGTTAGAGCGAAVSSAAVTAALAARYLCFSAACSANSASILSASKPSQAACSTCSKYNAGRAWRHLLHCS